TALYASFLWSASTPEATRAPAATAVVPTPIQNQAGDRAPPRLTSLGRGGGVGEGALATVFVGVTGAVLALTGGAIVEAFTSRLWRAATTIGRRSVGLPAPSKAISCEPTSTQGAWSIVAATPSSVAVQSLFWAQCMVTRPTRPENRREASTTS